MRGISPIALRPSATSEESYPQRICWEFRDKPDAGATLQRIDIATDLADASAYIAKE